MVQSSTSSSGQRTSNPNTDARIEKERKLLRHLPKEYKFSLITGRPLGTLLSVSIFYMLIAVLVGNRCEFHFRVGQASDTKTGARACQQI